MVNTIQKSSASTNLLGTREAYVAPTSLPSPPVRVRTTLRDEFRKAHGHAAYARRLGPWLRHPLGLDAARRAIKADLGQRERALIRTLRDGVFGQPKSPYISLLRHAGVELGDVEQAVTENGIDGALAQLYDAGVRVTLDELKGRVPITRPGGLELAADASAFMNPLVRRGLVVTTEGTSGTPRTVVLDLRLLERDAGHLRLLQDAVGLVGRPIAAWRPSLPATPGINHVLLHAKLGQRTERWFAQLSPYPPRESPRSAALLGVTLAIARAAGQPIPAPRHVPLERADVVAQWIAHRVTEGTPPFFNTTASGAVRVCEAARTQGLDISNTTFRVGGEPYTPARNEVVTAAGCLAYPFLQANEVGRIGVTCAARSAVDEVHLLTDKLAVLQRDVQTRTRQVENALVITTIWPYSPKLLLNVESDDTALVEHGACGCPLGDLGLTTRLHTIRSWEKLTTEGMTFTAAMTLHLVEEALPQRFGGGPTDYQLVEDRSGPISKVSIVISPRVGPVQPETVREVALQALGNDGPGPALMANSWREAGLPHIERREPYTTSRPKLLPVHVIE